MTKLDKAILEVLVAQKRYIDAVNDPSAVATSPLIHDWTAKISDALHLLKIESIVDATMPETQAWAREGLKTLGSDKDWDLIRDDTNWGQEHEDVMWDLVYGQIDPRQFYERYVRFRRLVLPFSLPEKLMAILKEIHVCYASCQWHGVIALSRMLLEAVVLDIGTNVGVIPAPKTIDFFGEYPPWKQMDAVACRGTPLRRRLGNLYERMCAVIHARIAALDEKPEEIIQETLGLIESLYAKHRGSYRPDSVETRN